MATRLYQCGTAVVFALLALWFAFAPATAHSATTTVPPVTEPGVPSYGTAGQPQGVYSSPQAACDAAVPGISGNPAATCVLGAYSGGNVPNAWHFCWPNGCQDGDPYGMYEYPGVPGPPHCPDHSSFTDPSNSSCTCAATFTASGSQCVGSAGGGNQLPECQSSAGKLMGATGETSIRLIGRDASPGSVCDSGCSFDFIPGTSSLDEFASKNSLRMRMGDDWFGVFGNTQFRGNGHPCTADSPTSAAPPVSPAPVNTPPGKCKGTVNGVEVLVACTEVVSTATSASAPPGAASGPVLAGSDGFGPPGSSIKTDQTSCTNGVCTTTSTTRTTASDGTKTSTSSGTSKDQGSFCQDNPRSPQCSPSQFTGACRAAVSCDGDAVQCQIAKEQLATDCANQSVANDIQQKYDGLTGSGVAPSAFEETTNVAAPPPLPVSACPLTDSTVAFGMMTLNMPLGTYLCPKLAMIRAVIVTFGSLLWLVVVSGVKGG